MKIKTPVISKWFPLSTGNCWLFLFTRWKRRLSKITGTRCRPRVINNRNFESARWEGKWVKTNPPVFLFFRFTLAPLPLVRWGGGLNEKFDFFVWHFPVSCLNFPRIRKSLSFLLKSFILIALFSFKKGGEEDTSKQNIHPLLFSYSSYFHGMKVDVYFIYI